MKDEFLKKLEENEELLFYGISSVKKTSRQLGRIIIGFIVLLLFWVLLIGFKNDYGIDIRLIICIIVLSLLTVCLIYGTIYNIFLKYKKEKTELFVTNKHVATYESKKGFTINNISDIEDIGIWGEKNNYGDLIFSFKTSNLLEKLKNTMSFEGVENPRSVAALIININNKIRIYDDRPTILGRKI